MSVTSATQVVSPSEAVVDEVAAREGVDPMELGVPLFEAVDPDALDAVVRTGRDRPPGPPVQVAFTYYGYAVIVTSDGLVHVSRENSTS